MFTIMHIMGAILFLLALTGIFIACSWIYLSFWGYVPKTVKLAPDDYLDVSFNGSAPQDSITITSEDGIVMEARSVFPFRMKINDNLPEERSTNKEKPPIGWKESTCYAIKYDICKKLVLTNGKLVYVRLVNTSAEDIIIVQSLKKTNQRQFGYAGIGLLIVTILTMLMAYGFYFDAKTIFMM
jgi:hypothetical protein